MSTLHLLCAGAAKGVVSDLQTAFGADTGAELAATFGAVGAIRDALDRGAPCDVIVLTAGMVAAMAQDDSVIPASIAALGCVRTGVAVRAGDPLPALGDAPALRTALLAADAIHFPDPDRATAGIHFVKVMRALGIYDVVAARLQPSVNGAAAMAALADSFDRAPIGCTQVTEIRYTQGVTLAGPLPPEFELATVYSAAVMCATRNEALARRFVALLGGPQSDALRRAAGFEA